MSFEHHRRHPENFETPGLDDFMYAHANVLSEYEAYATKGYTLRIAPEVDPRRPLTHISEAEQACGKSLRDGMIELDIMQEPDMDTPEITTISFGDATFYNIPNSNEPTHKLGLTKAFSFDQASLRKVLQELGVTIPTNFYANDIDDQFAALIARTEGYARWQQLNVNLELGHRITVSKQYADHEAASPATWHGVTFSEPAPNYAIMGATVHEALTVRQTDLEPRTALYETYSTGPFMPKSLREMIYPSSPADEQEVRRMSELLQKIGVNNS